MLRTQMALQHPEGMVVEVVVLTFIFANTEQGGGVKVFLPNGSACGCYPL
jgi:hypothetical protein